LFLAAVVAGNAIVLAAMHFCVVLAAITIFVLAATIFFTYSLCSVFSTT